MSSFLSDISPSWPSKSNFARYMSTSGSAGSGGGGGGGGGGAAARLGGGGTFRPLLEAAEDGVGFGAEIDFGAAFTEDLPGRG